LTGRFRHLIKDGCQGMDEGAECWGSFSAAHERTIAQKLNKVGYKSYAIGKWHVGAESWAETPSGRGFERYFGNYGTGDHFQHCRDDGSFDLHYEETVKYNCTESSRKSPCHLYPSEHVGKFKAELYDMYAKEFIHIHKRQYPESPMFLYYAQYSFHSPLQVPDYWLAQCPESSYKNYYRRRLCAQVHVIDSSLKNLTQYLTDAFGTNAKWVVLVTSDNGGPTWRPYEAANNFPLRGNKGEPYEGGIRTQAIVTGSHPELSQSSILGQTYSGGFVHMVDWHATMVMLGHATPLSTDPPNDVNGTSVWQALLANSASPRTKFIGSESGLFLRSGNYKLVKYGFGGANPKHCATKAEAADKYYWLTDEDVKCGDVCQNTGHWWKPRHIENCAYLAANKGSTATYNAGDQWMLFDISSDPSESNDLAQEDNFQGIKHDMVNELTQLSQTGRTSSGTTNHPCTDSSCVQNKKQNGKIMRKQLAKQIHGSKCKKGTGAGQALYPTWEEASPAPPSCGVCDLRLNDLKDDPFDTSASVFKTLQNDLNMRFSSVCSYDGRDLDLLITVFGPYTGKQQNNGVFGNMYKLNLQQGTEVTLGFQLLKGGTNDAFHMREAFFSVLVVHSSGNVQQVMTAQGFTKSVIDERVQKVRNGSSYTFTFKRYGTGNNDTSNLMDLSTRSAPSVASLKYSQASAWKVKLALKNDAQSGRDFYLAGATQLMPACP